MNDVERIVMKIVGDHLGIPGAALNLRTHITNELGADSLDRLELITTVEEYFEFQIPKERIYEIETIEDLVESVKSVARLETSCRTTDNQTTTESKGV